VLTLTYKHGNAQFFNEAAAKKRRNNRRSSGA